MIPRKHLPLVEVALRLLDEGATYRDVQKRYGVSESTLRRYKAAAKRVAQIPLRRPRRRWLPGSGASPS